MDELDSSLHPFVSAQLLKLFRDPATDPGGARLVFSSRDATLLGRIQGEEVLHRDHIWFTEKNECGVTELFPLSEFKLRQDEHRDRRCLAGRYGAVPIINETIDAWWPEALAFITTGITNARTEGTDRLIKDAARVAFGFRNLDDQRRRVRLACTHQTINVPAA
ncbi:AAA family ATPase [Streptosporangium canum]|uniref:AAA family ATPase n=1 Tax=Streptosporangium canum TaxID=324952 RepID=UPI0037AA5356